MYLLLHCHHHNDSCIKMGSDESHFHVSFNCEGQSHKTVSTEEKGEPKRIRTEVPASAYQSNASSLGQTGSPLILTAWKLRFKSTSASHH